MKWAIDQESASAELRLFEKAIRARNLSVSEIAQQANVPLDAAMEAVSMYAGLEDFDAVAGDGFEVFGGVAHISIKGMLLSKPDPILALFGVEFSDYASIAEQVMAADSDETVEEIVFHVNSPGGLIEGMFQAGNAIAEASTPTRAVVENLAASAAYFLASQADTIEATDRSDRFGSVGVMVSMFVDPSVVSIASSNAPNKAPDVTTDAGREVVRSQLNQVEGLFMEAIARGRQTTVEAVQQNFGRGGLMVADLALGAGMIDAIAEGQEMPQADTQASGVRAALGLDKNTGREDMIRACIEIKGKADEADALAAENARLIKLNEAGKTQLAQATARVEELEARDKDREKAAFEAKREAVIQGAVEDNKILPAQKEHYIKLANDEASLEGLVDLFAVSTSLGLTEAKTPTSAPKGAKQFPDMTPEQYSKVYRVSVEEAERILANREAKNK